MKKVTLLILALALGDLTLSAQTRVGENSVGIGETRRIKTTALQVYEQYINALDGLTGQSGYSANRFYDLFDKGMDSLCNDILPDCYPAMLTPEKYVEKYSKTVKRAYYDYSNFKMGEPISYNDKWKISCSFECDVQYVDKIGVAFPSKHLSYMMCIVMDKKTSSGTVYDNRYITSLKINEKISNYVIIHNPNGSIKYNGSLYRNNAGDYWIGELGKSDIKSLQSESLNPFAKTTFSKIPNEHNRYEKMSSKSDVAGVGIYYAPFCLGTQLDIEKMSKKGNAVALHAIWGKNLISSDNVSLFFNTGLNLYRNNQSVSGDYEVHYSAVDSDGDDYLRNIVANLNKESIVSYGISLPLTISYLLALNDPSSTPVLLSLEAGGVASYKVVTLHSFDMDALYTGTYNYFGGVEFDHYYDYGKFKLNQDVTKTDFDNQLNKFDVAAAVSVGLWVGVTENSFLRFDLSMLKGFISEMKYKRDYRITSSYDDFHSVFQSSDKGAYDIYVGLSYIVTLGK